MEGFTFYKTESCCLMSSVVKFLLVSIIIIIIPPGYIVSPLQLLYHRVGDRTNILVIGDWPESIFLLENGLKFVFYSAQREKSETRQSHSSFCGLGNFGDLRHLLYLASSAPPSCSALKSTYCGHDFESIRQSEIFLNHLLKNEREK